MRWTRADYIRAGQAGRWEENRSADGRSRTSSSEAGRKEARRENAALHPDDEIGHGLGGRIVDDDLLDQLLPPAGVKGGDDPLQDLRVAGGWITGAFPV